MRASSVYGIRTLAYTDRVSFATRVKHGELAERVVHKGLPYLPRTVAIGEDLACSYYLMWKIIHMLNFQHRRKTFNDEISPIYGIYLESAKQGSQQM